MTGKQLRWSKRVGKSLWALADQGIVSLGTFLSAVVIARTLAPTDYGLYALIYGSMIFLNNLHAALVIYPLSVRGAPADPAQLRQIASYSLVITAILLGPQMVILGVATGALQQVSLLAIGLVTVLAWQTQETLRRSLMAHLRYQDVIWGDSVSYLGQLGVILILAAQHGLSLQTAFGAIALTSGLAAMIQYGQLRLAPIQLSHFKYYIGDYWQLGCWVLLGNFVGVFTIQAFPWTLAFCFSPEESAKLSAVATILGVSHPIMFGLGNLLIPAVAKAFRDEGVFTAQSVAWRYGIQGAILLLPYYLGLLLVPEVALQLFYGSQSPYLELGTPLRLFVIVYVFNYALQIVSALLRGLEQSRTTFWSQLLSSGIAVTIGLPLAALLGVIGATLGSLLAAWVGVMSNLVFLRRISSKPLTSRILVSSSS